MKKHLLTGLSAACLVLAAVFKFALIGYTTLALCSLALAAVFAFYRLTAGRGLRKTRAVFSALLVIGAIVLIAAEIPVIKASRGAEAPEAGYIIVLGAGVNGSTPSLSMVNRLDAALEYLEAYPEAKAVVSGGQGPGEDITEARAMYDWLTARGVSPERIILEEKATSTRENLALSLELITELGYSPEEPVAVCSSEYHLCRAEYLASSLGLTALGVPAETTKPVLRLNYFIREGFAMLYYLCFNNV